MAPVRPRELQPQRCRDRARKQRSSSSSSSSSSGGGGVGGGSGGVHSDLIKRALDVLPRCFSRHVVALRVHKEAVRWSAARQTNGSERKRTKVAATPDGARRASRHMATQSIATDWRGCRRAAPGLASVAQLTPAHDPRHITPKPMPAAISCSAIASLALSSGSARSRSPPRCHSATQRLSCTLLWLHVEHPRRSTAPSRWPSRPSLRRQTTVCETVRPIATQNPPCRCGGSD
jgi:hypothetical protein